MIMWKDIVEGYGLHKVGRGICTLCGLKSVVYTDEPLPSSSVLKTYNKQTDLIRHNSWCKTCAIWWFGDTNG
jgi:hypothetical protein